MKTFILKLFCFMLIVSTTLFIGTACKNEDGAVSQGLEFEISYDKTGYAVAGIGDCFDTKIIIPSTYNDKPVVEIKEEAFKGYCLTSITIPNSVTSIGGSAFSGCPIETATIPTTAIGYIPKSKLKTVILTGGTSIGEEAFYNCDNLTSVTIPNSVTSIGERAFFSCVNLTSIEIPNSVTSIGDKAFYWCNKLVEVINKSPYITITKGSDSNGYLGYYALSISNCNDSYISKVSTDSNGFVTYTNCNDKILVGYVGTNTNITIPSDITEIYEYAFYENKNITSITIGNSVTSIGSGAFSNCTNLTSVTIGNSVTSIGGFAFSNCTNLTSITYNGTKSKWNSISKGIYWNSSVPATYVTCTDGKVSIEN